MRTADRIVDHIFAGLSWLPIWAAAPLLILALGVWIIVTVLLVPVRYWPDGRNGPRPVGETPRDPYQ